MSSAGTIPEVLVVFKRVLDNRSPSSVSEAAECLYMLMRSGFAYSSCVATLSSARDVCLAELDQVSAVPERRWRRAQIREAFHLIRSEFQCMNGRCRAPALRATLGRTIEQSEARAFVDGSLKQGVAAVGFSIEVGVDGPAVEASLRVDADDPTECELEALRHALRMVHALGLSALRVFTDAQALVALFSPSSKLASSVIGRTIIDLAEKLDAFEIVKVPRLYNHRADRLAAAAAAFV